MNIFDLVLLLLLAGAVLQGYRTGLILQAAQLAGWLIAMWAAWHFTDDLAPVIADVSPVPDSMKSGWLALLPVERLIRSGMAFAALFFGIRLLLSFAVSLLNQAANLPVLAWFNRAGGAIVSFLKFVLVSGIAVHLLHALPWETGREAVQGSLLAQAVLDMTPEVTEELKELFLGQRL